MNFMYCSKCGNSYNPAGMDMMALDYCPICGNPVEIDRSKELNIALCAGRHEIPEAKDGAIYNSIDDVTDISAMNAQAAKVLEPYYNDVGEVNLYVTGLTVALVSVINIAHVHNVCLTLWHYNNTTGKYYHQTVF